MCNVEKPEGMMKKNNNMMGIIPNAFIGFIAKIITCEVYRIKY